jgi:hypothetical protein
MFHFGNVYLHNKKSDLVIQTKGSLIVENHHNY